MGPQNWGQAPFCFSILFLSHIEVIIDDPSKFIYIDEQRSQIFLQQKTIN